MIQINKIKKIRLFFILVILLCSITACDKKYVGYDANEITDKKKPVEVEFWYGFAGKSGDIARDVIKTFNESQSEVFVKGMQQDSYDETMQALQAAIATRKVPTVVALPDNYMQTMAQRGILAELDQYFDKKFNVDDFISPFIEQGRINGKTYSLPIFGTTQILYYRKDIFEEAGISPDVLNTWEDLGKVATKLTKKNGDKVVVYGWEPIIGRENLCDAAQSRGAKYLSDDGKTVTINTSEWIDTWEQFRKWIHEDKSMRIHYGGQGWEYWYATIDDVMQGRAAGYTGSSGDQGDLDFNIIAAHIQPGWKGCDPKPYAAATTICIPNIVPQEQKDAAFKFMKYFTSAQITAEWSMKTGYIVVRKSSMEIPKYKKYLEQNPQALVTLKQADIGIPNFCDPTGGAILNALLEAAKKVEISNVPAAEALNYAQKVAQKALDEVLAKE